MKEDVDITNLSTMIKTLHSIVEDNLNLYTQNVEEIIDLNCKDEKHIESTLDRLLDLCFDDKILLLYKKLCRYYYGLNQEAAKDYVKYYFETYEEEKNSLVLDIRVPIKETQNALNELEQRKGTTHNNVKDLFKDLDSKD